MLRKHFLLLFVSFACQACSASYSHKLDFNPAEPLRVAILPFAHVDAGDQIIDKNTDLAIDNVSLVSSKLDDSAPGLVRKLVYKELSKSSLDLFSPGLIDSELSHHDFADHKMNFNLKKIFSTDPKEICQHVLNCDAVLYGRIRKWDRNYYAIQSVNTVALDLKMVAVRDGRVIFSASAQDSDSRGLSKGPTGFSDLVIEPVRGLDSEIITDLARKMAGKMLEPLRVENRPEYLKSSPPSVYGAAHDAHFAAAANTGKGVLSRSRPLIVLMYGSPGKTATFSIGEIIQNVPMSEVESSHYTGEFHPLPDDSFSNQPVFVSLTDEHGRSTRVEVGSGRVTLR